MSIEEDYDDEVTALYRKWVGRVQGFLVNMGCDTGLAEEIADDAFLGTRRHWVRVRTFNQPESYAFKIARNERARRQKLHDERANDLLPDPPSPRVKDGVDPAALIVDRDAVQRALQRLPRSQREAVTLRDIGGLPEAAAAEIMGVSIGAVKRYTSEGRQKLCCLLAEFRPRSGGNDR